MEPLAMTLPDLCLRLLCAIAIGTIIGLEREYTHRPAGLRTHMIVALGASSVMITSELLFQQYAPFCDLDPARLPAQVIAGVGFLGAGTILREGVTVKGLTTAASLWTVACLSLAAGAGYYLESLIGAGMMFIILTIFERLQTLIFRRHKSCRHFSISCTDISAAMETVSQLLDGEDAIITKVHMDKNRDGLHIIDLDIVFRGRRVEQRVQAFTTDLTRQDQVCSVKTTFSA